MKAMRIALAGLALAGVCQGVWGGYYTDRGYDGRTVVDSDTDAECSSYDRNRMSGIEKFFDKVFSGGYKTEYEARLKKLCGEREREKAAESDQKAIKTELLDACKQRVRQAIHARDTLTFHVSGVSNTDSGYVANVTGSSIGGHIDVKCYADSRGNISRVLRD